MPPILVPNVDDLDELAHHISIMFYITAGVATLLFILVIFGKNCNVAHGSVHIPKIGFSYRLPVLSCYADGAGYLKTSADKTETFCMARHHFDVSAFFEFT